MFPCPVVYTFDIRMGQAFHNSDMSNDTRAYDSFRYTDTMAINHREALALQPEILAWVGRGD